MVESMLSQSRHFFESEVEKPALRVTITGAAGNIGSMLVFMIAQGRMFGPHQKVILQLLELPHSEGTLKGIVMEINDSAFPLVDGVFGTLDAEEAFNQADIAILVGAKPRGPGMERKDLLSQNAEIFKVQGEIIDKVAKKTIKVLVVGNPANTNALICSHYAPSIPKENFTAMTRLDHNRTLSQVAEKSGLKVAELRNVIIWGNHSSTQYPDINQAEHVKTGVVKKIAEIITDEEWVKDTLIKQVQNRGAEIISVKKFSSVPSAASAACDQVHDWIMGTRPDEFVSMGVSSNGNSYGIAEGLVYSFPVKCTAGKWEIVDGLEISDFSRSKMTASQVELLEERKMALDI